MMRPLATRLLCLLFGHVWTTRTAQSTPEAQRWLVINERCARCGEKL